MKLFSKQWWGYFGEVGQAICITWIGFGIFGLFHPINPSGMIASGILGYAACAVLESRLK